MADQRPYIESSGEGSKQVIMNGGRWKESWLTGISSEEERVRREDRERDREREREIETEIEGGERQREKGERETEREGGERGGRERDRERRGR